MILYSQSAGCFTLPDGTILSGCYSGNGEWLNLPGAQSVKDHGPIPQGQYTISPAHTIPHLGPIVMALTPSPANTMFGRSGFFIHGDNADADHTASDGCIVCGPDIRQQIADLAVTGEDRLTVEP